jgi:hypothetical protein
MGGGAGFGGFGQQQGGFGGQQQGGFGGQQQNPSSGVGGFGRPQGGFNNRQGGFGQQAGFNGFNPQQQFQNPYGPPQMQQMYTPYSQMDQNQFGFQQPQAFRDYQQQQQARMFQNPYQQNPYQQNPYQQNPYQQQFGRQGGFGFGQQPQYTQHPQQQLLQRMGVIPGQPEQQLPQQTQSPPNEGSGEIRTAVMPQEGTPEYQQRMQEMDPIFQNMSQAERMRVALDDSGMGRGGYQGMSQDERIRLQQYGMPSTQNISSIYTPDHYQQQPRGMTMDMPQYGSQQAGLQQLLAQMQGQLRGRQMPQMAQQAQRAVPPGMERRMGMGGEYFVPAGTQYNPFMD